MTLLLKRAFEAAAKLSDVEQNIFAQWILNELKSERKWDKAFSQSEDVLSALADQALAEHEQGKTRPLNLDES